MRAALVVLVLLLGIVAVFAVQNPGIVSVNFLHVSASTSLLVVIAASFAVGVFAGILVGIPSGFRRRRRIKELESEVAAVRAKAEESARAGTSQGGAPPSGGMVPQ